MMHALLRRMTTISILVLAVLVLGLTTHPSGAFAAMVTVDFGAVGNGTTDDRAAWVLADAATTGEIVATAGHTYRIASNLTITSPVYFAGGKLKPDSGVTVTLAGGVIAGSTQQLFDISSGGVVNVSQREQWVDWWGAVHDLVTDDAPEIQAAITSVGLNGGGDAIFACDAYGIAGGLVMSANNVILVGCAYQFTGNDGPGGLGHGNVGYYEQFGGTVLTWIGTSGTGTMLTIAAPVTGPNIYGNGIHGGMVLNGASKALIGLSIISQRSGSFGQITVADCQTTQVSFTTRPVAAWTSADPTDTQHNQFERLTVTMWNQPSALGILLDGESASGAGDVSLNVFNELNYVHKNGVGLHIKSSGGNQFRFIHGFRDTGGTGVGVLLDAGNQFLDGPNSNNFGWVQTGPGGMTVEGTASGSLPPIHTKINTWSLDNGSPLRPIINLGASVSYNTEWGEYRIHRDNSHAAMQLQRASNTDGQVLGRYEFLGYDSASVEKTFTYIDGQLTTNTAAAEVGTLRFVTKNAGADVVQGQIQTGLYWGTPTGGFLGVGTINASADFYKNGSNKTGLDTPTYGGTINQRVGHVHRITATNGTAFTVSNPTNSVTGDIVTVMVRNTSGGVLGVLTWGGSYKLGTAWVQPANGFSRSIQFLNDGTNWVEINRAAAAVAN